MVRMLDWRSVGRGFDSRPPRYRVQPGQVVHALSPSSINLVTSASWENNRRSGVALSVTDIVVFPPTCSRPQKEKDEHPADASLKYGTQQLPIRYSVSCRMISCVILLALWIATDVPTCPQSISVTDISAARCRLNWKPPLDDGGSEIIGEIRLCAVISVLSLLPSVGQ